MRQRNTAPYSRWRRWSDRGVFARMEGLSSEGATPRTVMIDATSLKARRTGGQPAVGNGVRRLPGPSDRPDQGGMNARLHAVADADGRPLRFFLCGSGQR